MKKRRAVQGGPTRWSIQKRKNYMDSSYRSTCRGVILFSGFDAYLRIYSHFQDVPNKSHSFKSDFQTMTLVDGKKRIYLIHTFSW